MNRPGGWNARSAAQASYVNNLRTNFTASFRNRRSAPGVWLMARSLTKSDEADDRLLEFVNFDLPLTSNDEGESMEGNWVNEAVLDVAYYLRSHKFNEYDRRAKSYTRSQDYSKNLFVKFPEPPLRSLHWEVADNCENGFLNCLKYLHSTISSSKLNRATDTATLIRKYDWSWKKHHKAIEKIEEECRNLYEEDWANPEPFQGPLQRFQFRVTASYYMCKFTMEGRAELSMFGEPCDNFGSCLVNGMHVGTNDPRADDRKPYACARYSFCPDPCCPVKYLKSDVSMGTCAHHPDNPCIKYLPNNTNKRCSLNEKLNTDFVSLTLNRWNTTCCCSKRGYEWDSRFASCVDIDECRLKIDSCNRETETCHNLEGTYFCGCAAGMWYDFLKEKCTPNPLTKELSELWTFSKKEHVVVEERSIFQRISFISKFAKWVHNLVRPAEHHHHREPQKEEPKISKDEDSRKQ